MLSIIHDSDLHYGQTRHNLAGSRSNSVGSGQTGKVDPRPEKASNPETILQRDSNVDFVIVTGDLTENGYDGKSLCCYQYGGDTKQLQSFKRNYVQPLEEVNI